ncbi:alpha/beta fold hydrolase [Rhodococcus sp. NPDC003348]
MTIADAGEVGAVPTQRREVVARGATLSYHVANPDAPGRPVVLLHPWFGCWQFWTPTIRALEDRPCFAVDFYSPAAGHWDTVVGPEGLAEVVLAMMDSEGLDQIDLVGNSVGGIVAQVLASSAPERVRTLVLVGTGAGTVGCLPGFASAVDDWIAVAHAGAEASRAAIDTTVGMLVSRRPDPDTWNTFLDMVAQADPAYLAATLAAARQLDLTPRLGAITAPTLVVRGSEDCARTPAHVEVLVAGIPDARAVEMAGAGHSPMVDHPDEFNALVVAHLNGDVVRS